MNKLIKRRLLIEKNGYSQYKEIYYKIKKKCQLPVGLLNYTYKDIDDTIHPFNNITIIFNKDEESIKKMEETSLRPGFMFFNNSDEGIKFWEKNIPGMKITFKFI